MLKHTNNTNMELDEDWKKEGKRYLQELQKFLDKAENIENEELRKEIIIQMLKCDDELTKLANEKIKQALKQEKRC